MSAQLFWTIAMGALAAWFAWARMKYPNTTPPWAMGATLAVLWVLLGTTAISGLDLLGLSWFRDVPQPAYVAAAFSVAALAWMWSDGPPAAPERRRWPDYVKWDKENWFELYQVACLWVDEDPQLPMPENARSVFLELKATIERGDMTGRFTTIRSMTPFRWPC